MVQLTPQEQFALIGMQVLSMASKASQRDIPILPIGAIIDVAMAVETLSNNGDFDATKLAGYAAEGYPSLVDSLNEMREDIEKNDGYKLCKNDIAIVYNAYCHRNGDTEAWAKSESLIEESKAIAAKFEADLINGASRFNGGVSNSSIQFN